MLEQILMSLCCPTAEVKETVRVDSSKMSALSITLNFEIFHCAEQEVHNHHHANNKGIVTPQGCKR